MQKYQCGGKIYQLSRRRGITEVLIIWYITKTESNNCFIIDFKLKIINMAVKQ